MINKNYNFENLNVRGLSETEASLRQKEEGYNEILSTKQRNIFNIAVEIITEPMFLLLVGCALIYLVIGDIHEAMMLFSFVIIIMGITFFQENKTEKALEALRDLSSPRALVIREGKQNRIAGKEVVRGDIIVLTEGDRVPADAIIIDSANLSIDESLLTGESVPVRKRPMIYEKKIGTPGGDDLPFVYSGTLTVEGHGIARVEAIGNNTEFGKIGEAIKKVKSEETILWKETNKLIKIFTILGLLLCTVVVIVYGLTKHNWLNGMLAGLTLAMAMLPEEFPVVLTVFMALGAWRISKKNVLTRYLPAIETLGSATVLCVDKTGTLTLNKMKTCKIFTKDEFYDFNNNYKNKFLPEKFHNLVEFAILASQKDPFDPIEKAIKEMGNPELLHIKHLHNDWILLREYQLSKNLMALSHVWNSPDGSEYVIASKGAPEAIANLCHFDKEQMDKLMNSINLMAKDGLRILGVAKAYFKKISNVLPDNQHDFNFEFLGLIGLTDPIRPSVPDAIKECYNAGIKVVMITGDYPGTAMNIANQIGLKETNKFIDGNELSNMSDKDLQEKIEHINIFARVVPEQKLRIVQAYKTKGEIVCMTGDGVNDAPALKSAHIGIAMGQKGTDVARESASLVLLDDDFSSIVQAVKTGRRIFDNLKKAMSYIFAIHIPIAGISLIPVIFNWPLVLLPVHIVFLELIIDPACSIVFEAEKEEADIMNRPPRNLNEPLFNRKRIYLNLIQGLSVLFAVLIVFIISFFIGRNAKEARTLTFVTLVISNLVLILMNRSLSSKFKEIFTLRNEALYWVICGTLVFLGLILYVPLLRDFFKLTILHPNDLFYCFLIGIINIFWLKILKRIYI